MNKPIFFINGSLLPKDQANIAVLDLAILRGYGVFDFTKTYNGKPFYLDDHLRRLQKSAELIDLEIPWDIREIKEWVYETLKANNFPESQIRIVVTGGPTDDSITPKDKPTIIIIITPVKPYPESFYQNGVKVITYLTKRLFPEAKTINYIPAIIALRKAAKEDAIEAIYIDKNNYLLEGTTSNLFVFKDNILLTAKEGILYGITRKVVLNLIKTKFRIEEGRIKVKEIPKFSECFITASNKEVMPVVQIDNQRIGDGKPGKNTKFIMQLFKNLTRNYR